MHAQPFVLHILQARVLVREEREESALAILCAEALKRRERDCKHMCSRKFVTSFTEYNKDKVSVDVATSLVVNHVNIGVLCPFLLYYVYVYGEFADL